MPKGGIMSMLEKKNNPLDEKKGKPKPGKYLNPLRSEKSLDEEFDKEEYDSEDSEEFVEERETPVAKKKPISKDKPEANNLELVKIRCYNCSVLLGKYKVQEEFLASLVAGDYYILCNDCLNSE